MKIRYVQIFFCEYHAFNFKNSTQLRKLCNFIFNAHPNFGNVESFQFFLFSSFSNWSICNDRNRLRRRTMRFTWNAWNEVKRSCLLPPQRSVLQLHRISLRATWYQPRFYASIFEKYLISAEIYRHAEITISRKAKNNRV